MKLKDWLISISIVGIATLFWSCTKPDIAFGADYLEGSYTNVVIVDTATPLISTVLMDSFITSATGKAVVGKYSDPYFGVVTAESYFAITPATYSDVYSNTTLDSLELIIKPDKSFYGDTMLPLQINVNQLRDKLEYAENKTVFYNVTSFATSQLLGCKTFQIRPSITDSIAIRLSNTTGANLLRMLQSKDELVQSQEKFTQYFKGLNISAANTAFMLGFSDSIIMRLHYKKAGIIQQSNSVDFTLADASLQFNHISINRSGTALSILTSANNEVLSSATNNAGFLQSSTGTVVKIGFPYLKDFLAIKNLVKIVKAELVIEPVNGSFNGLLTMPPQLRLSETTQLNQIGTDLSAVGSDGTTQALYGDLITDDLYGQNTSYAYDVTTYINTQIAVPGANKNGLIISAPTPSFESAFNRLLIGDKANLNGSIKLRLYYVTVKLD
jgi:hypothetical protein